MDADQPLNVESLRSIVRREKLNLIRKPISEMTADDMRQNFKMIYEALEVEYDFSGDRSEVFIPSAEWPDDGIPAYVYRPKNMVENPPIWVYFYGGGLVLGSRMAVDSMCKMVADRASCLIVSSEYRLTPENKLPAAFEDAIAVTKWVTGNKTKIGGSDCSIVGVGGSSAGGTLAATAAHEVQGLGFQILTYPSLCGLDVDLPSRKQHSGKAGLPTVLADYFRRTSGITEPELKANFLVKPFYRDNHEHIPQTLFIVAECDILRDDSYEYSKKLTAAGVQNEVVVIKGAMHGFFPSPGVYKNGCKQAYDTVAEFIHKLKK